MTAYLFSDVEGIPNLGMLIAFQMSLYLIIDTHEWIDGAPFFDFHLSVDLIHSSYYHSSGPFCGHPMNGPSQPTLAKMLAHVDVEARNACD